MSDKEKKTNVPRSLDELVEQSKTFPLPCRVFMRPDLKTSEGKPCAMFVGLIPLQKGIVGPDISMAGKVMFVPHEISERPEFNGWLIEDVLKHGF